LDVYEIDRFMEEYEYRIMRHIENTYWWFRGKQFLVEMLLKKHLDNNRSNMILDIGTGTGAILELLQRYGDAYGVDVSTVAIQMLAKTGHTSIVRSDAEKAIPFKSATFSIITCLDVLEHLENDRFLLDEMVRVCKPNGVMLITVPAMGLLWSNHDVALHHKRRYTKRQLLRQIGPVHCNVIKASYFNASLFVPIAAVRILKSFACRLFLSRHARGVTGGGLITRGRDLTLKSRLPEPQEVTPKSFRVKDNKAKSDFFMPLPEWLNSALYYWYRTELACLGSLNFPFGVSIVLLIRKPEMS
jgi:2-polyprenyl-3-methyl-5-hydroxy-6-metoxy-1,4-benzoquinol methylase